MNASLRVCTPITSANDGTLYFGVKAVTNNPRLEEAAANRQTLQDLGFKNNDPIRR